MKLRARLIISFFIMLVLPVILIFILTFVLMNFHLTSSDPGRMKEELKLSMIVENPIWLLSGFTVVEFSEINSAAKDTPEVMEDKMYLNEKNSSLLKEYSYLLVRKGDEIIFNGSNMDDESVYAYFKEEKMEEKPFVYMDPESDYLLKKSVFQYRDGIRGDFYVITDSKVILGQIKLVIQLMMLFFVLILLLTAAILTLWLYRGFIWPLRVLRKGTQMIIAGDLEQSFTDNPKSKEIFEKYYKGKELNRDEIGMLFYDFEQMRLKMKGMIEERIQFEKDQSDMISNISHDLKTPLTAIKGYAEGLMDGVADTSEKQEKYLTTIYKKADDMTYLVDELSFYSKIDCNTIPYEFRKVNLNDYFMDCIEDISLDLEIKNINLTFFNYADQSTVVVADVEKLKRVIYNLIENSKKYMNKEKGIINIRIRDKGIFLEVEVEDNGCGIDENELDKIFDRFYRSDISRNSKRRGSGLGLAISKKIIEDHGGKMWATSLKNIGTSIFFTLCRADDMMVLKEEEEDIVEAEGTWENEEQNSKKGKLKKGEEKKAHQEEGT